MIFTHKMHRGCTQFIPKKCQILMWKRIKMEKKSKFLRHSTSFYLSIVWRRKGKEIIMAASGYSWYSSPQTLSYLLTVCLYVDGELHGRYTELSLVLPMDGSQFTANSKLVRFVLRSIHSLNKSTVEIGTFSTFKLNFLYFRCDMNITMNWSVHVESKKI